MHQATLQLEPQGQHRRFDPLDLPPLHAGRRADAGQPDSDPAQPCTPARASDAERSGFDIGWDHAHHGLVPPPELMLAGSPVCQGWMAGKAVYGRRTLASKRVTRQWLQLRLHAWRLALPFDLQQVTPNYLGQIHVEHCPVTRLPLQGLAGSDTGLTLERLNPEAGYAAGNLAVMSSAATRLRQGVDVAEAVRRARALETGAATAGVHTDASGQPGSAAPAALWWRLAALRSFATPLPFAQAARLPLAVLPPNRVRLLNAVQGLQALLTRCFMTPGWAARCQRLAQSLPAHSLRLDFNLFVGAMAPRVLEAGQDPRAMRHALQDAWLLERVQRRWLHLVLSLGEAGVQTLLERATVSGLAGVRTLNHAPEIATEAWGLPQAQDLHPVLKPRATRQPAARPETNPPPSAPGFGG